MLMEQLHPSIVLMDVNMNHYGHSWGEKRINQSLEVSRIAAIRI
jgi:hypothetical protein